jgi:mannose-1-phosphate guanylyltransferase
MPDVSETATTTFIETRTAKYVVAEIPRTNLLIQPRNRGTAPTILYSLMRVREKDEEPIVAFFPSDNPEPEYGWIEPGLELARQTAAKICRVSHFWEKPCPVFAKEVMAQGCLWNSFVMVGHVRAFLNLFVQTLPSLTGAFESIRQSSTNESLGWSDLGEPSRVFAAFRRKGTESELAFLPVS